MCSCAPPRDRPAPTRPARPAPSPRCRWARRCDSGPAQARRETLDRAVDHQLDHAQAQLVVVQRRGGAQRFQAARRIARKGQRRGRRHDADRIVRSGRDARQPRQPFPSSSFTRSVAVVTPARRATCPNNRSPSSDRPTVRKGLPIRRITGNMAANSHSSPLGLPSGRRVMPSTSVSASMPARQHGAVHVHQVHAGVHHHDGRSLDTASRWRRSMRSPPK